MSSLFENAEKYIRQKPKVKQVPGLDWGFPVYVRRFSIAEAEAMQESLPDETSEEIPVAVAIAKVICDENGEHVFDSEKGYSILEKFDLADLNHIAHCSKEFNEGVQRDADKVHALKKR